MASRKQSIVQVLGLNILFTIIEAVGGILTNSTAILADALHDFGDSIVLASAWFAERRAETPPDGEHTFGHQRYSLISALLSGVVLLIGSSFVVSEAISRIIKPEHVNAGGMIGIAIFGIALNGIAALRLHKGKSLNQQVLTWHILEDVFGWIVILVGSILLLFWDNHLIDPIMSLGFTVYIVWGVSKRLKETFNIFMEGVPKGMDVRAIKKAIGKLAGVEAVHDVHIWSLEGETNLFTGHLVVEPSLLSRPNEVKQAVRILLKGYQIQHATIELESPDYCSGPECELPTK